MAGMYLWTRGIMFNEKFSSPEISLEDRVKHLEEQLPLLGRLHEQKELFQKLDYMVSAHDGLTHSHQSLIEKVRNNDSSIKEMFIGRMEDRREHENEIALVNEKISNLGKLSNKHSGDMVSLAITQDSQKKEINNFCDLVNTCVKNYNELSDIQGKMKETLEALGEDMDRILVEHESLYASQHEFSTNISQIITDIANVKSNMVGLKPISSKEITEKMVSLLSEEHDNLMNVMESHKQHFLSKIDALPKPIEPSYDAVKAEINHKFEPTIYDAKNANLRAHNNETRIMLLEKKIEQLFLLLKSYELHK